MMDGSQLAMGKNKPGLMAADQVLQGRDDGLADGSDGNVGVNTYPGGVDANNDGFVDGEQDFSTDPNLADSDGDELPDGLEVANGADPGDDTSWPNLADGDLAPLGNPDGTLDAADYLIGLRIAQQQLPAKPLQLAHCDLHPVDSPDGKIDAADLVLLLQMIQAAQ